LPQLSLTPLYNDNKSIITLATKYSGNHKRIRYMLPFINWLIENGKEQLLLLYLRSEDSPADVGTKRHGKSVSFRFDSILCFCFVLFFLRLLVTVYLCFRFGIA
jgi:hypothetical protein